MGGVYRMMRRQLFVACIGIVLFLGAAKAVEVAPNSLRLGFFEAGESVYHSELRREFLRQLDFILPDSISVVPLPEAYGSGDWKRDSCRAEAERLATVRGVDIMITMGPWVVEDLLEAGYVGPIIAMHRVDPMAEGLLNKSGRPIADNLTVHGQPGKIENDLATLAGLKSVKQLGVLYFSTGDERPQVIEHIRSVADGYGMEITAPEANDNHDTFAFFKSYGQLPKTCDAVYVLPLWGMSAIKTGEFFKRVNGDRRVSLAWEGKPIISRGATLGIGGASLIAEARFNAQKTAQIRQGAIPADLPVFFAAPPGLIINEISAANVKVNIDGELRHEATIVAHHVAEPENFLTLREVLHQIAGQNPERLAADESVAASEHNISVEKAALWPRLQAQYRLEHFDNNSLHNSDDRLQETSRRASLRLDQALYSRKTHTAIKVAKERHNVTLAEQRRTRLRLELVATASYLDILEAMEMLALAQQDRNRIDVYYEQAQAVYLIDSTGLPEVLGWRSERAAATNRLTRAETYLTTSKAHLNSLMNYPTTMSLGLDTSVFTEETFWTNYRRLQSIVDDPNLRNKAAIGLIDRALRDNASASAARLKVDLVRQTALGHRSDFWPEVGIFANYNYNDQLADRSPDFHEESSSWSLGGQIRWPIFLGGRRWHLKDRSNAEISRSEYERDAVSLSVMDQTNTDLENLLSVAETCLRSIRADQRSGEALHILSESYDGQQPNAFIRLNDASRRFYRDRSDAIRMRYDFWFGMAKLISDLGISQLDSRTPFFDLLTNVIASDAVD